MKKKPRLPCLYLSLLCLLLTLATCNQTKPETQKQFILEDGLGREVKLSGQPKRVLSLATSMTEMLFAVLDTSTIVGRTQNDDYPAAALAKPIVNNYPVDFEQVLALKPDLIFTVEGITPLDVAARLEELGIPVYYQKYETVEDIFSALEDIGQIMGRAQQATQLADSLRQEVARIEARHRQVAIPQKVLGLAGFDPIYVYGHSTVLTDKLRILGARNAVPETFDALTREYILKSNPDVLLGGTPQELEEGFFRIYPELRKIKAYQNQRLYAPSHDLMARPSPRVVESIRELEKFLYP
ncbi:helical backbone metal receptor [Pontibacter sp. E15-1]|uniref:ABC transporter substrate-binding protein n=1 Tax=Pontibacter sp. E15-1 TaxID=2919918 RepID=UPI001F4F8801|nr:helical backbone metal receptor [Pontibacter sp. E15-1]MCJ8165269.1 helical backbone metal receptor [Pontibacter sp. E15-1]